jgi:fructokinase
MGLYGGMEIGGTKCVCAIGTGPNAIRAETRFATTTAKETLARAIAFFAPYRDELVALGVGAFGPLDLRPDSSTCGCITTTPKPDWAYTNVVETLQRTLACPVVLDTDVNVAAFGEYCWGNAQGLETFVYLTVGTGIGGGAMVHERLLHGMLHPEMGHMRIPHDWQTDPFAGTCPYHGDCLEGLAAGPALLARWGQAGETLPANHDAWKLEARYLALALVSIICTLSPQRLILGGGVMQQQHLFPLLRHEVQHVLNGYLSLPDLDTRIDAYIVPPLLGDRAGVLGALALAWCS